MLRMMVINPAEISPIELENAINASTKGLQKLNAELQKQQAIRNKTKNDAIFEAEMIKEAFCFIGR